MDFVLLILSVILIFILVSVYILSSITKTTDLHKLMTEISKLQPLATAYTLGQNDINENNTNENMTFKNIYLDKNNEPVIRIEKNPTNYQGKPIILQPHGDITHHTDGNGYKISGLDTIDFKCPDNYGGENCILNPLCTSNNNGAYKPLSFTQFNGLGLYLNEYQYEGIVHNKLNKATEENHPRIRVHCLDTLGNYKLETCPDNTKLNFETMQCDPYDICEDHINGYKHNMNIDKISKPLNANEFYMCENNNSVLQTCTNDTKYSADVGGCITETPCFNRGFDTIKLDSNNYLQCSHDREIVVNCPLGVINDINNDTEVFSCIIASCKPEIITEHVESLVYDSGEVTCINDQAIVKLCDTTSIEKIYNYKWAEDFKVKINSWPKEVYMNGNCVEATNDIIHNPIIQISWSAAMPQQHPYNIITEKFVCDESTTKYRWDYLRKTLDPMPTNENEIINSASPCQNGPIDSNIIRYPANRYPEDTPAYIIITEDLYLNTYENLHLWPYYNANTKLYMSTSVDYTSTGIIVETSSSKVIPFGFIMPDNKSQGNESLQLHLVGYTKFIPFVKKQYYFIATGLPAQVHLSDPEKLQDTTINIPFEESVTTKRDITFAIDFTKIKTSIQILPDIKLTNTHIEYQNQIIKISYMIFQIKRQPLSLMRSTFILGEGEIIKYDFNNVEYPLLHFTSN
ncbi:vp91 [Mauternbach virus]|uniref:Vp91 n=1 Tax=Mauternbach virus TaxID=2486603 RepID=A0A3G3E735_9VIRU|nr:vp91 [Mauternbach virus]AYP97901.1 vp91 [Mauternbach virus]